MARGEGKITASELHHSVTDILDKVDILSGGDTKEKVNKEDFNAHISNKSNPHGVSKNDVGLGNVENYGIATKSEAEAGTSNTKYMTPLRVREAIDLIGGDKVLFATGKYNASNRRSVVVGFKPVLVIVATSMYSRIMLVTDIFANEHANNEMTGDSNYTYIESNGFRSGIRNDTTAIWFAWGVKE